MGFPGAILGTMVSVAPEASASIIYLLTTASRLPIYSMF